MKRLRTISLMALSLALTAAVAVLSFPSMVRAADDNIFSFSVDIAADCRTFVGGPNRGDLFILSGKVFPAGTLPPGPAAMIQPNPLMASNRSAIGPYAGRTHSHSHPPSPQLTAQHPSPSVQST